MLLTGSGHTYIDVWRLSSSIRAHEAATILTPEFHKARHSDLYCSHYVAPLAELIKSFGVHYHQYAEDPQLYIANSKNNMHTELGTLQRCTSGVQQWLMQNGLLLTPTKSDAFQFTLGKGRSVIEEISTA